MESKPVLERHNEITAKIANGCGLELVRPGCVQIGRAAAVMLAQNVHGLDDASFAASELLAALDAAPATAPVRTLADDEVAVKRTTAQGLWERLIK